MDEKEKAINDLRAKIKTTMDNINGDQSTPTNEKTLQASPTKAAARRWTKEDFDKATAEDGAKNICGGFGSIEKRIPVVSLNGVPVAYFGEIVAVKGRAKAGKSHFAALLMAACMAEQPIGGQVYVKNGLNMLIFDTEQSDGSATLRYNCALRTAGNIDSLAGVGQVGYTLIREYDYKKRREILLRRVEKLQPDIVYIDGVRQLMADFNDSKESGEIIDFLKVLTDGDRRVVFVVIHTNPTDAGDENGKKMRGHIGTELENAAQSVLSLSRKKDGIKNIFKIETSVSRDDVDTQLSFTIIGTKDDSKFSIQRDPEVEEKEELLTIAFSELDRTKEPATKGNLVKVLLTLTNPRTGKLFTGTAPYKFIDRSAAIHVLDLHDGLYYLTK